MASGLTRTALEKQVTVSRPKTWQQKARMQGFEGHSHWCFRERRIFSSSERLKWRPSQKTACWRIFAAVAKKHPAFQFGERTAHSLIPIRKLLKLKRMYRTVELHVQSPLSAVLGETLYGLGRAAPFMKFVDIKTCLARGERSWACAGETFPV